ncbi:hypothetical protein M0R04_09545, partial [Candidatus Dojkabacteria bacterium]|nr:hypothetical protein [Candidatus Dojkabacteria bacterium]
MNNDGWVDIPATTTDEWVDLKTQPISKPTKSMEGLESKPQRGFTGSWDENDPAYVAPEKELKPATWKQTLTESLPEAVKGGLAKAVAGGVQTYADVTGNKKLQEDVKYALEGIKSGDKALREKYELSTTQEDVVGAASSLATNIPFMVVGTLTGGSAVPLIAMGTQSGLQKYADYRGKDKPIGQSAVASLATGGVEIITELTPMNVLLKKGTPFFKRLAAELKSEIIGENAATFFQDAIDAANQEMTWGEFINAERLKNAAWSTTKQTAMAAGVMTGGAQLLNRNAEQAPPTPPIVEPQTAPTPAAEGFSTQGMPTNEQIIQPTNLPREHAKNVLRQMLNEKAQEGFSTEGMPTNEQIVQPLIAQTQAPGIPVKQSTGKVIGFGEETDTEAPVPVVEQSVAPTPQPEQINAPTAISEAVMPIPDVTRELNQKIEKPVVAEKATTDKQPHEVTLNDYIGDVGNLTGKQRSEEIAFRKFNHAKDVEEALIEGKDVPIEVLADYKDEKWAQKAITKFRTAEMRKPVTEQKAVPEPSMVSKEAPTLDAETNKKLDMKIKYGPTSVTKRERINDLFKKGATLDSSVERSGLTSIDKYELGMLVKMREPGKADQKRIDELTNKAKQDLPISYSYTAKLGDKYYKLSKTEYDYFNSLKQEPSNMTPKEFSVSQKPKSEIQTPLSLTNETQVKETAKPLIQEEAPVKQPEVIVEPKRTPLKLKETAVESKKELTGIQKAQQARAEKSLDKYIRLEGKSVTKRQMVEQLSADGYIPKPMEVFDEAAKKKDELIAERARAKYIFTKDRAYSNGNIPMVKEGM